MYQVGEKVQVGTVAEIQNGYVGTGRFPATVIATDVAVVAVRTPSGNQFCVWDDGSTGLWLERKGKVVFGNKAAAIRVEQERQAEYVKETRDFFLSR